MTCWVRSSHSSYHPAKFLGLASCESKDKIFKVCQVITSSICHVTLSLHPAKFGIHRPCESGDITSLIYLMTTCLMYHVACGWVSSS